MNPGSDEGSNGRVKDAVLETKIDHLTELVKKALDDHETRIRCLERQSPWRTLAEAVTGALAAVGVWMGAR